MKWSALESERRFCQSKLCRLVSRFMYCGSQNLKMMNRDFRQLSTGQLVVFDCCEP
jgi:hypothetical protein